jgi:hypothetical protein
MRSLLLAIIITFVISSSSNAQEGWTALLDKDLSQWDTYLSYRHKIGYKGKKPSEKPVGYHNNEANVFSIVEENGEPVLRISGEIYGCIFTKQVYDNYHLKLQVRWGKHKADPRKDKLKDSGILYHSNGEAGVDYWRAWMLAQEFQIMEGHMGDYWGIANAAIDIRAFQSEGEMNSIANEQQPFLSFGAESPRGVCLRKENHESPSGEWTTIELICFDGKSIHIVNGHVVMVLKNSRYVEKEKSIPLTKGKIQLQSEAAEVFYKNITIKKLSDLPTEYAALF